MKYVYGALIGLLVASAIFAQTGNDIADNGLQAGTEIAQAIADKNFASTMGKLTTRVGPYLGMVGPVVGILFSVLGMSQDSPELQFMQTMLAKIENRFDQVDQRLDDIARKIDWNRVRIQFFTYEKKILPMKIELDKFYKATTTDELKSFMDTFMNMYECVYENSAQMLFNHIISGESTFSSNLLLEAMKANEYDRKEIQVFMLGLTKLILVGSQIELTYYRLKELPLETHTNKWTTQMDQLRKAMEAADREVENKYQTVAMDDAKRILTFNKGGTHNSVAQQVYNKLTSKFYWRNWFVGVYDAIGGNDNHQVWLCGGGVAFRHAGFNLLVSSNLNTTKALDKTASLNILNQVPTSRKGWWMTHKNLNAQEMLREVKINRSNCGSYSGLGVIRSSANFHSKASADRMVTTTRGRYILFLFH